MNRLKTSKDEKQIKELIGALRWKFTGRDHRNLANLNLFTVLHRGNNDKDNLLKKAWGRNITLNPESISEQSISKDVLEFFE